MGAGQRRGGFRAPQAIAPVSKPCARPYARQAISAEGQEGMNAFLEGRKPNFQGFRMRNKREMEKYLAGNDRDLNAPPSMRRKR